MTDVVISQGTTMDQELKAKWVAALRSGKFRQGRWRLYDSDTDTFCCLGVLGCVIGKTKGEMDKNGMPISWDLLPEETTKTLAYQWNDSHCKTFDEIADYIEKSL
jgi:hypothetical protein